MPSLDGLFNRLIKAAGSQKDEGAGAKNWWRWPLLIVVVLIAVAVFAWMSRRNAKELAKLRHEKKKREVAAAQADSDRKVAVSRTEINEHAKKVRESMDRVKAINAEIRDVEAKFEADKEAISRIRTWDDVGSEPSG